MNRILKCLLLILSFQGNLVGQYSPIVIKLDGKATLQEYDGLGAITSYDKLLYDYPEPQRSEILDYLFRPGYGAALQILKVEIGYDGNNTGTAWPSHQPSLKEKPDYTRGMNWWLMLEARKRNPLITLAALHWGYPAWAVDDILKARFIFDFVAGAKKAHGLLINYIGGNQNESVITPEVTKRLRQLLDENGLKQVRIVAADEGSRKKYSVGQFLDNDNVYSKSVDVIGVHFKSREGLLPDDILNSGKKIWSSEDGGGDYINPKHGYGWASQVIHLLQDVRMNGAVRWCATAGVYDNMPWAVNGIIKAKEPWSGYYEVGGNSWGFAHFTQFTQPGWKVLETNAPKPDTFVSAKSTTRYIAFREQQGNNYTLVFTTGEEQKFYNIDLSVSGGLSNDTVYIWRSDFNKAGEYFQMHGTVKPVNNRISVQLDAGCVYTLTTMRTGGHGKAASPLAKAFPKPYRENFERYSSGKQPAYFLDADGNFEVAAGEHGKVLRQTVAVSPLHWHYKSRPLSQPLTEFGDINWTDYTLSADALLESAGTLAISGRFDGKFERSGDYLLEGYWLFLDDQGNWRLIRKDSEPFQRTQQLLYRPANKKGAFIVLDSGKISVPGLNTWINLKLEFRGGTITAYVNKKLLTKVQDEKYKNGNVAIGALGAGVKDFFTSSDDFPLVRFDNVEVY